MIRTIYLMLNLINCVKEKVPYVAKKLNWVDKIGTFSLNFSTTCNLQDEDISINL